MKVISGFHPVEEALKAGVSLHAVYLRQGARSGRVLSVKRLARERGVKVLEVPPEKMRELAGGRNCSVAALVSEVEFLTLEELLSGVERDALLVVLDGVTDVGNVGAIIRTVEVVGAHGVVLQERNSPYFGEGMVRASAGAIWKVPVARVKNISRALEQMKEKGLWVVGAVPEGGVSAFEFDFDMPMALVLGSEDRGIRPGVLERCDYRVSLPQRGSTQSLNVSVAAGVLLYLAARCKGWY